MAKKRDPVAIAQALQAALETHAGPERAAAYAALRGKLPPGVPHDLLRRFWAEEMRFPAVYFRLRHLPDAYVEPVMAGLRAWSSPASTFLVSAVSHDPGTTLHDANEAFRLLHGPTPFTPKGRKTILAVMALPAYRTAAQDVVRAHGWEGDARQFMIALVHEGSPESARALAPSVHAACGAARTDIARYAKYATTDAMRALFEHLSR